MRYENMAIQMMDPRKVRTKNFLDSCWRWKGKRSELQDSWSLAPSLRELQGTPKCDEV